jgi:hypothetical protein
MNSPKSKSPKAKSPKAKTHKSPPRSRSINQLHENMNELIRKSNNLKALEIQHNNQNKALKMKQQLKNAPIPPKQKKQEAYKNKATTPEELVQRILAAQLFKKIK